MSRLDRRDVMLLSAIGALSSVGAAGPMRALAQGSPTSPAAIRQAMHGLEGVDIPRQITVIGIGGNGCWVTFLAALAGVEEMLLIDAADVSEDDLGRTLFRPADVGKPKSQVMAEVIQGFRPEVKATALKRFVEPADEDVYFGSVMFDGTNYRPLSEHLPQAAAKRGMAYAQGFYWGHGVGASDRFIPELEWSSGKDAPVWPPSAAMSGILAVYSAFVAPMNYFGDITKLDMGNEGLSAALSEAGVHAPAK